MNAQQSAFRQFWQLGYDSLVPVIPPDAPIRPSSNLFKRVGTPQDARGKMPGVRDRDGLWGGMGGWTEHVTQSFHCDDWASWGASVGIRTGGVIAIDADILNETNAYDVAMLLLGSLGQLPTRVGNRPKAIYVCRVAEPYPYTKLTLDTREGASNDAIEILTNGKHFVAHGIHPKTGKPYVWDRPLPHIDELPVFTAEQIDNFMSTVRAAFPYAGTVKKAGVNDAPPDDAAAQTRAKVLSDNYDRVEKAMRSLPNTDEHFPTRESYVSVGQALRGALPNDIDAARALFTTWAIKWPGRLGADNEWYGNTVSSASEDFRRFHPSTQLGATYLFDLAERIGDGTFTRAASDWFEPLPDDPAMDTPQQAKTRAKLQTIGIDELLNRPPKTWLVKDMIPDTGLGFVFGPPGAGKSFIALDMGLTLAHGMPAWHGRNLGYVDNTGDAVAPLVLYIASEGSFDLGDRVHAWLNRRGLAGQHSANFRVVEATINFMAQDDVQALADLVAAEQVRYAGRICLIVIDTVSRAIPGADENTQKDMSIFVRACDALRERYACVVMGVHHSSKAGDMRGSTVLSGAADFVYHVTKDAAGDDAAQTWPLRSLYCEKLKGAADGWTEQYRYELVALDASRTSLVIEKVDADAVPATDVSGSARATEGADIRTLILDEMQAAFDAKTPWSLAPQMKKSPRYAVSCVREMSGMKAADAWALLNEWKRDGIITVALADEHRKVKGLRVMKRPPESASIFD